MKKALPFSMLMVLMLNFQALAQLNCKTKKSNDSTITTCFHANKQISSRVLWGPDKRWGKLICYDAKGKILLEWGTRTVGGHATAHLSYYPNGQVSKAEYSSHPDGGIQWYRQTMKFDESGKVTYDVKDGTDHRGNPLLSPTYMITERDSTRFKPITKPKPKQEVVTCAELYFSILQVENNTKSSLKITVGPRFRSGETKTFILTPTSKIRVDSVMQAEFFEEPDKQLSVKVQWLKPKRSGNFIVTKELPKQLQKSKTLYRWVVNTME